jgi:DNA (cytosine-5)-methyltransferase 1
MNNMQNEVYRQSELELTPNGSISQAESRVTPSKRPELTVAEYFAGIGLVRMGLEQLGWKVIFANDFSDKKFEMYQGFFPDTKQHYKIEDIFGLIPSDIPSTLLATCSFPCIDLSLAGNRSGIIKGAHSSAFWGFIDILKGQGRSAPPLVMVENVPGWLTSNKGNDFRVTVQALNDLGYACDVFILNALRFTAQSRLRVFLIGSKNASSVNAPERIISRSKSLLSQQLKNCIIANRDLNWFYQEIPEPPVINESGLSKIVESLEENDGRWWPVDQIDRHLAMMNDTHRSRIDILRDTNQISYRTFYRRRRNGVQRAEVRDDDLSGCLRTAVGGSGRQFLIQAGNGIIKMRTMTPREYARLQGVPDEYKITASDVQALTGFGDAVCVPAISWIAEFVLNPLAATFGLDLKKQSLNE